MKPGENEKAGPITDFLVKDHGRLEGLLQSAVAHAGSVDQGMYDQFRAGLLRHIGMEEKILLPAAQRLRGGEPLSIAAKLRLDHGAIASLLMPPPTVAVIATIRAVLKVHNTIEEGPGGLYETCDALAGSEAAQLLAVLKAAPELAVLPCSDSPVVMPAVVRALERAGYSFCEGNVIRGSGRVVCPSTNRRRPFETSVATISNPSNSANDSPKHRRPPPPNGK